MFNDAVQSIVMLAFQVRKTQRKLWSTPREQRTGAMTRQAKALEKELDDALILLGYSFSDTPEPDQAKQEPLL